MFGMIKTNVKLDKLERSTPIQPTQKTMVKSTFVSSETQDRVYEKKLNFKQDIDVRGMRGDEAIQAVTYFIDDAILLGIDRVRILHGTGTGILRTPDSQLFGKCSRSSTLSRRTRTIWWGRYYCSRLKIIF